MLGNTFYNQSIRKVLVAFGTLFNNINIERTSEAGLTEVIKVPLSYVGRERFVAKLAQAITGTEVQTTLPRMSFEWTDIVYDPTRKLNTMSRVASVYLTLNLTAAPTGSFTTGEKITGASSGTTAYVVDEPTTTSVEVRDASGAFTDTETITGESSSETATISTTTQNQGRVSYRFQRVPYDLSFTLAIACRTTEDGLKVVEQILPFFTPEFTVTIKDVLTHDMPVVLDGLAQEDTWEGDLTTDRRFLVWSLAFTAKAYLYGPPKDSKIITKTITQIYNSKNMDITDLTMITGGAGTFSVGENIYQRQDDNLDVTTAAAEVVNWNSTTRVLQVTNVSSTDGTGFKIGRKIFGVNTNAIWTLDSLNQVFEDTTTTNLGLPTVRITNVPDPASADADDEYAITETITER